MNRGLLISTPIEYSDLPCQFCFHCELYQIRLFSIQYKLLLRNNQVNLQFCDQDIAKCFKTVCAHFLSIEKSK